LRVRQVAFRRLARLIYPMNISARIFGAMPRCIVLLCISAAAGFAAGAPGPSNTPAAAAPAKIGVLLLPPTDTEPWSANVLGQRQLAVRRRLQHDLLSRGFTLYPESLAEVAAAQAPKIDLVAPGNRTGDTLAALAKRSGAHWVVSVEVQEVAEDPKRSEGMKFHCFCRVDLKVWDATRRTWLANGRAVGHDQGDRNSPVWLFMEAIDDATRVAIAPVISAYPVVVDMGAIGPIGDYLSGKSEPFTPHVGQPLGGLSLPP
jgi:hypothetical protein